MSTRPGADLHMRLSFRPEIFVTLAATLALSLVACTPKAEDTVLFSAGQAASEAPAAPPADEESLSARPVIVMLGDSLTAGYQLAPQYALPEQLQAKLDEQSVTATILNAGVSGDTTRGGLERYDWSVKGANADILLIALGANDFLSGMDAEAPKANLAAIIERAQSDGLMIGLIGISAFDGADIDSRDQQFDAIYPDLAARYDIPLFPNMMASVFGHPEILQSDGIHPTAEGVDLMAKDLSGFVAGLAEDWRAQHDLPVTD